MHNQHSHHIDQATVDRWQADGVVLLKGVFTPWVERLAEGVTALMASPSEYGHARTVIPKDGSPPFFQDYCNWSRIPAFSEFVFQSAAAEIAAALLLKNRPVYLTGCNVGILGQALVDETLIMS